MKRTLKQFVTFGLSITMALSLLSGCGGDSSSPSNSSANGSEGGQKVALVLTQSLGDSGPSDDMNSAVKRAQEELGIEATTYEALQPEQYEESLRNFAQNGYDMIVASFPAMTDAVKKVAADFPDVKFVHIYSAEDYGLDNVVSIDFACWEANYVCGVAAAMASESGQIGHVIGGEDNTIRANYNALVAGARSVNPNATVEQINAGTFDDPAKGKEIALSLYGKGVDVIIGDAGKVTLGIIEAAEETGNYVIGDASDHSSLAPGNVLMDTALGFGAAVYDQISKLVDGTFTAGLGAANYANGGISTTKNTTLAENCTDEVMKEKAPQIWEKVAEVEAQITDGTLVVEKITE